MALFDQELMWFRDLCKWTSINEPKCIGMAAAHTLFLSGEALLSSFYPELYFFLRRWVGGENNFHKKKSKLFAGKQLARFRLHFVVFNARLGWFGGWKIINNDIMAEKFFIILFFNTF